MNIPVYEYSATLKKSFISICSNFIPNPDLSNHWSAFCVFWPFLGISYKRKSITSAWCVHLSSFTSQNVFEVSLCISSLALCCWIAFYFMDTLHFPYPLTSLRHLAILDLVLITYMFLCGDIFISLGSLSKGNAELYAIVMFNFIRIWQYFSVAMFFTYLSNV